MPSLRKHKVGIHDVIMLATLACIHRHHQAAHVNRTVYLLSLAAVRVESSCYSQGGNKILRDGPRLFKWKLTTSTYSVSQASFLPTAVGPDAFVNTMVSTQKKDSTVVAQACFFALLFLQIQELHVGHGNQLVVVWSKCLYRKIKPQRNLQQDLGVKFCFIDFYLRIFLKLCILCTFVLIIIQLVVL